MLENKDALAVSNEVSNEVNNSDSRTNQMLMGLPVSLTVEVGKAKLSLNEMSNLTVDSVLKLDKTLTEPLNVVVNNTIVATAELVVVENHYAVRILELKS